MEDEPSVSCFYINLKEKREENCYNATMLLSAIDDEVVPSSR